MILNPLHLIKTNIIIGRVLFHIASFSSCFFLLCVVCCCLLHDTSSMYPRKILCNSHSWVSAINERKINGPPATIEHFQRVLTNKQSQSLHTKWIKKERARAIRLVDMKLWSLVSIQMSRMVTINANIHILNDIYRSCRGLLIVYTVIFSLCWQQLYSFFSSTKSAVRIRKCSSSVNRESCLVYYDNMIRNSPHGSLEFYQVLLF